MSKVINFNTRDFVFDANCKANRGFRGFVTTPNGNEEIWEIGDWNWNWTQIITVLTGLEPDTDYVFRFAMTLGHNDDNREESLVNIFPAVPDADPYDSRSEDHPERLREAAARQKAWDARYTYCIRQSRFQRPRCQLSPACAGLMHGNGTGRRSGGSTCCPTALRPARRPSGAHPPTTDPHRSYRSEPFSQ